MATFGVGKTSPFCRNSSSFQTQTLLLWTSQPKYGARPNAHKGWGGWNVC